MLKLYISTTKKIKIRKIFNLLTKAETDFQLSKNYSYCKGKPEYGYKIVFFDMDKKDFKSKVWNGLEKLLDLKCAFVKYKDYMGCVTNWPNVFTKTCCPQNSLKHDKVKLNNDTKKI